MATYRLKVPQALHRERFDKVVHTLLNTEVADGVSKSVARKLVMAGACYLNGSRCRIASKPVFAGGEVRVEYDAARARKIVEPAVALTPDCILYHKEGLLIVNKPANLPTVPTLDDARNNLVAELKQLLEKEHYLGERTDGPPVQRSPGTSDGQGGPESSARTRRSLPATVYLGIHHRLDAQTSGCILFTTDEKRNGFVSKLFQEHLVQKEYLAVCTVTANNPPRQWEIKNQLVRAEKKRNRYASTAKLGLPDAEGSYAYSRFEVLQQRDNLVLVKCIPVTGRTHQLRVHLSEYGLPILGDRIYGGVQAERLMLHAHRLAFREEGAGTEIVTEAPVPEPFKRLFDI